MEPTNWLGTDQFDWVAGGLAISLLVGSFVMIFVIISARKRRQ